MSKDVTYKLYAIAKYNYERMCFNEPLALFTDLQLAKDMCQLKDLDGVIEYLPNVINRENVVYAWNKKDCVWTTFKPRSKNV